jgi:hypothetical protein
MFKNSAVRLIALAILVSSAVQANAQTKETFDIVTFRPPAGFEKKTGENSIQFSSVDEAKNIYCVITLFKSMPGPGDSKENFDLAWRTVVKEIVGTTAAPVMQPSNNPDDWKAEMGSAPFEKDGMKGVAVLVTLSGYGKMVSTLILTNSETYEPAIKAFLESASLKKMESAANGVSVRQQAQPASGASVLSVTSYSWKQTQNRKDAIGGYAGYSSNTYQFLANNTYKFSQVTFQNHAPKYYLEDEEGTYNVAGDTITLMPKKGMYRSYRSTREDPVSKSGNLELTTTQYKFEIVNLNNNWTLLLSPVDGVETKRDGQFSFWLNGEKRKTYSYNSVNAQGELIR